MTERRTRRHSCQLVVSPSRSPHLVALVRARPAWSKAQESSVLSIRPSGLNDERGGRAVVARACETSAATCVTICTPPRTTGRVRQVNGRSPLAGAVACGADRRRRLLACRGFKRRCPPCNAQRHSACSSASWPRSKHRWLRTRLPLRKRPRPDLKRHRPLQRPLQHRPGQHRRRATRTRLDM